MHIFRPRLYETRNQPPEKIWKGNKYLETEEHPIKNEWANQAVKEEVKKDMEVNENDSTITQNLCDTGRAVTRGKYPAIQAFLKKEERS